VFWHLVVIVARPAPRELIDVSERRGQPVDVAYQLDMRTRRCPGGLDDQWSQIGLCAPKPDVVSSSAMVSNKRWQRLYRLARYR